MAQARSALNSLEKCWKSNIRTRTKLKIFDATVMSILLYACESWSLNKSLERKIDGCYTRMLRRVKNINRRSHTTNAVLYNERIPISQVIRQRRLRLAGHVIRGNEPATSFLGTWNAKEKRSTNKGLKNPHWRRRRVESRRNRTADARQRKMEGACYVTTKWMIKRTKILSLSILSLPCKTNIEFTMNDKQRWLYIL